MSVSLHITYKLNTPTLNFPWGKSIQFMFSFWGAYLCIPGAFFPQFFFTLHGLIIPTYIF
jgi:hypothetical protein